MMGFDFQKIVDTPFGVLAATARLLVAERE